MADAAWRELRRRHEQQPFDYLGEPLQIAFVLGKDLGIAFRELGDLLERFSAVLPHEEVTIVRERGEKCRIFGVDLVSEAREIEVPNDPLLKKTGEVGAGGNLVAWPDIFS